MAISGVQDGCDSLHPPPVASQEVPCHPRTSACAEKDVPMTVLTLLNNGFSLFLWAQASSHTLSPVTFGSPAHRALLPIAPSGCVHTANPSPLPGTDFQSLSLSAQPSPECLRYGVPGSGTDGLCSSLSALSSSVQLLCFFLEALRFPLCPS